MKERLLTDTGLPVRVINALGRQGVDSVEDAGALTLAALLATPNFGVKSATALFEELCKEWNHKHLAPALR